MTENRVSVFPSYIRAPGCSLRTGWARRPPSPVATQHRPTRPSRRQRRPGPLCAQPDHPLSVAAFPKADAIT